MSDVRYPAVYACVRFTDDTKELIMIENYHSYDESLEKVALLALNNSLPQVRTLLVGLPGGKQG